MDGDATLTTRIDARAVYKRRALDRHGRADWLAQRARRIAGWRKYTKALLAAAVWQSLNSTGPLSVARWACLLALIGVLAAWANRVARAWRRAACAADYYDWRLQIIDDRWPGAGDPGTEYLPADHRFAADLDLFGVGSLYERLCTARTRCGRDALAGWLLHRADPAEIRSRQAAVDDLRNRLDLHEDLACVTYGGGAVGDTAALVAWGAAPPGDLPTSARPLASVIALLTAVALGGWLLFGLAPAVFWTLALAEAALAWLFRHRLGQTLAAMAPWQLELAWYAAVLDRWEREPVRPAARAAVAAGDAARELGELARLVGRLPFATAAAPFLGRTRLALAIEAWQVRHGAQLAKGLAAAGRMEALVSLAAYAFENPDDPFPEIVEPGPCFDAMGLGHPLLPRTQCVANDLCVDSARPLLIVSGSNMSGKSTLLRTAGANAVLAQAGAPVRAARLRMSPLALGATLRVQDSLLGGRSRFFAEITRLRQILDLVKGPLPVLFLLDELLSGTNSDDRRTGAEAVLQRLVGAGAVGLVTTHDLALTPIAERVEPAGANVHFSDRLEEDRLVFDYRLRPGVVQKRNALALMRAVGIDV
jgi:MutS domain V